MTKYDIKDGVAIIPPGTTKIENEAFVECEELVSVVIPDSVREIGYYAFRECKNLKSVIFPAKCSKIGERCFWQCESLTSITLPSSLTILDKYFFYMCSSLREVILPEGLECIKEYAFASCKSLTQIVLPSTLKRIEHYTFENSDLQELTIPASVEFIGYGLVKGCANLKRLVVEEANTHFDSRDNCNAIIEQENCKLKVGCGNSVIPNSVIRIGEDAFGRSMLSSITIPDSVKWIDCNAFVECEELTAVSIPGRIRTISSGAFSECKKLASVEIQEGVVEIERGAFSQCAITNIKLPSTLVRLSGFRGCKSLTELVVPEGVEEIGDGAFMNCRSLKRVSLPKSLKIIARDAFLNTALEEIIIPEGVRSVGRTAFKWCNNLKKVTLPSTLEELGEDIFDECPALESVYCHVNDAAQIKTERGIELCGHQATVYVPAEKGVLASFKKKALWKAFADIKTIA